MSTWSLTDLEFKVLCDTRRDGQLPSSFTVTSDIPTRDEYLRARQDALVALKRRADSEFEAILDVFTSPDVIVGALAWDDADFENPDKSIRLHAGRRGSRAYLIEQLPGRTFDHAGGFTITTCQPRALGDAVLERLPAARAGRRGPIPIDLDGPRHREPSRSSSIIADDEDDVVFGSAQFFDLRSVSTGSIQVVQGRSKYGPRGINRAGVLWRDLPDDGRYVMPLHHPAPVAVGMASAGLAEWVDSEIERILARMDAYQEVEL